MCVRICVYFAIFALKFHEGYKPDYAASQRCRNSILLQRIWIMWASLMDICKTLILLGLNFLFSSTVFRLPSFSTLASPVSLRNLLASRKKMWKLVFRLTATSKLMLFCWFSAQEVESSWGPHSPNSPAVWCSHFILARIEERWCSAARPRDTRHPSTGNTCRHGFSHTFHYLCFSTTHVTQPCRTTCAIKKSMDTNEKKKYRVANCLLLTAFSFTARTGEYDKKK